MVTSVLAGKRKLLMWLVAFVGFIAFAGIAAGPIMSRVEQPKYELVESAGSIEIRDYPELIMAEANVSGQRNLLFKKAFGLLPRIYWDQPAEQRGRDDGYRSESESENRNDRTSHPAS